MPIDSLNNLFKVTGKIFSYTQEQFYDKARHWTQS